jgi:hypothetical protein
MRDMLMLKMMQQVADSFLSPSQRSTVPAQSSPVETARLNILEDEVEEIRARFEKVENNMEKIVGMLQNLQNKM